ncbi:hypothetical protein ACTJJB_04430 [Chitinophaga sp. 22536]|uniref:hypothetical protein n=1 Tax=unclassified Chitinophaga TaxID=2619133 RepID=UPI003F85D5A5
MKVLRCTLFLLVAFCNSLWAQEEPLNPTKFNVIPPSPNAAALGKYGEIPVNLFNGLPNIEIPLSQVVVGNEFNMPVNLSYHAAGNRVDEVASFVGLGWALNAGGAITRTVHGSPDEYGYVGQGHGKLIPQRPWQMDSSNFQTFRSSALGIIDTQPDEFSYNFGNYSGKFVVDTNGMVQLMPYKNIRVKWDWATGNSFTITTENGTKYIFKTTDVTWTISNCGDSYDSYTSAWYLTTIVLPVSKRTINFEYISGSVSINSTSQTESRNACYGGACGGVLGCPGSVPVFSTCITTRSYSQQQIKKIEYPGGRISFNYAFPRTDVGTGQYALSDITISSNVGGVYTDVNKYKLNYVTPDRLKLQSVSTVDMSGQVISAYKLYYEQTGLPAIDAKSKDHWGYYNNANNSTLIPADRNQGLPGGNREPNSQYTKAGILEKIEYPTGGYTTFEFENHTYSYFAGAGVVEDPVYQTINVGKSIFTNSTPQHRGPKYDTIRLNFSRGLYANINAIVRSCCGNIATADAVEIATGERRAISSTTPNLYFSAGQHMIVLQAEHAEPTASDELVSVSLTYDDVIGYTKIATASGLRIRKITSYDGINHSNDIIKTYTYNFGSDTLSSGYLCNRPRYDYHYVAMKPVRNSNTGYEIPSYPCPLTIRTSAPNNEIESGQGSVVYREVLESVGSNKQNGSIRYIYKLNNNASGLNSYPFGPAPNVNITNGMLEQQLTFDNTGKRVAETINEYDTYEKASVRGWKTGYSEKGYNFTGPSFEKFATNTYDYKSAGVLLKKTTQKQYLGTGELSNVTEYAYDNLQHIQPTRIHKTTSKMDDLWIYNKYPTDYTIPAGTLSAGLQALKFMQDSNMHNAMIEQYTQQVAGGTATTLSAAQVQYKILPVTNNQSAVMATAYKLNTSGPLSGFVPTYILNNDLKRDNNYEEALQFNLYDNTGNIQEQRKTNDVNEVYIWGYNDLYPVAKIIGSTYQIAMSYIDPAIIRNPQNDAQLRAELEKIRTGLKGTNALVSTYTYKPQVGVTSETDPSGKVVYYEYDSVGRLLLVKDQNGKILKQYSYQYQQPVNQ